MKVLLTLCLTAALVLDFGSGQAQQPNKMPRIAFVLGADESDPRFEAFRQGMRELGFRERENIVIEYRPAESPERSRRQFAELMTQGIEIYASGNLGALQVAKQATKTIPIIMVTQADPVDSGLVDSLARPGGNITGITTISRELSGKRLEILMDMLPKISEVAMLRDLDSPAAIAGFKEYEAAARQLKIAVQSLELRSSKPDFKAAFEAAAKARVSAVVAIRSPLLTRYIKEVPELAIKHRLPSMYERGEFVDGGGLVSYSANDFDLFRRAATYVDRILKGAKPADLPVEQPKKFEFIINLKTAKQIGLTIPPNVLARADRVIR